MKIEQNCYLQFCSKKEGTNYAFFALSIKITPITAAINDAAKTPSLTAAIIDSSKNAR